MSYLKVKNRAVSALAADITDVATSLSVTAGEGAKFPDSGDFHLTCEDEIVKVTARSTDTLTVVRAQEGTTGAAHTAGKAVGLRVTAGVLESRTTWTADKLLKGAGAGADPTEIDVPVANVGGLYGINVEVLAGNKTLTPNTDVIYQYLDEGDANRIITLATDGATAGDRFVIRHNGVYSDVHYLEVKQAATFLDNIYAGGIKEFIFDGTNWVSRSIGTGENDDKRRNVAIGRSAQGFTNGVAIGDSAQGYSQGVAVGAYALSYNYGVTIGCSAQGYNYGVAAGNNARTVGKKFSIALGYYSRTARTAETSININGNDSNQENNVVQGRWEKATANATPVEMFCGGQANERFTIRASSHLAFRITVVARDNVANEGAMYTFEGLIKRDGANNTVLSVVNKVVIHEDDAAWDCAVTADDTNEALKITVTGDGTNATQFASVMDGVETHF